MTKSINKTSNESKRPKLLFTRSEADSKIQARIKVGVELNNSMSENRLSASEHDLSVYRSERDQWTDYNEELLLSMFDIDTVSKDYSQIVPCAFNIMASIAERVDYVQHDVSAYLTKLRSIVGRLELYEETGSTNQPVSSKSKQLSRKIFIVHGHDEELKQQVCRLVEHLGLQPIVLHEQSNKGQTIIEKFENHSDVAFAVVLLTPDDEARCKEATDESLMGRARQNVILELGFFIGKLGREKVCPLQVKGVEIPTDMSGVVYVEVDDGGGWKYKLAKEMKACGLSVDLNIIV